MSQPHWNLPENEEFDRLVRSLPGLDLKRLREYSRQPPTTVFRFNPLKHDVPYQRDLLRAQGILFDDLQNPPLAAQLRESSVAVGRTLSHFAGHIYVQALSSMIPVQVLNPRPQEKVLDMCAAPGSKATQIAACMQNQGVLVVNDKSRKRLQVLASNLQRFGVVNAILCQAFGEQYGNLYYEWFDRVLLDPPCSALGTLNKSPQVLGWWTPHRTEKLARIQQDLIQSAVKCLRPGGTLVYSTCTLTPEENESVIQFALSELPVEVETIELSGVRFHTGLTEWQGTRFDARLKRTARILPYENESEGFFIAALRKVRTLGDRPFGPAVKAGGLNGEGVSRSVAGRQFLQNFDFPTEVFDDLRFSQGKILSAFQRDLTGTPLPLPPYSVGLPAVRTHPESAKMTTELSHLVGHHARRKLIYLENQAELADYVNRQDVAVSRENAHQVLVGYRGYVMGHGKVSEGRLLSRFPRSGWKFEFS